MIGVALNQSNHVAFWSAYNTVTSPPHSVCVCVCVCARDSTFDPDYVNPKLRK